MLRNIFINVAVLLLYSNSFYSNVLCRALNDIHFIKPTLFSDTIEVRVGLIISDEDTKRFAKTYDRIKKNQDFQITILSSSDLNVYILSEQGDKTELLQRTKSLKDSSLILPKLFSYFQVDGESKEEKVLIILSLNALTPLESAGSESSFKPEIKNYVDKLKRTHKPFLTEAVKTRINIGGNVRDIPGIHDGLKLYKGMGVIVKEFFFNVTK